MNPDEKMSCCEPSDQSSSDCCPSTPKSEYEAASCTSPGCCASAADSTSRWKTLVFLLVMGAAVAMLAHALVKKSGKTTDVDQQSFSAGAPGMETSAETAPALSDLTLDAFASRNSIADEIETVFILLPGEDGNRVQATSRQVDAAMIKLRSKGKKVATFTLEKSAADYAQLVEQLSITSFPSVVAIGRGCGSRVVSGEITETKLLQAFVATSTPSSSCGPGGCQ